MVFHNPVLILLLEHIYFFCLLISSNITINSNLYLLGSYYVPETMLKILNILFYLSPKYYFFYFID